MIAAAAALMDEKEGKKASAILKAAAGAMGGHLMGQAKEKLGVKPSKPKRAAEAKEDPQPA
jgi:hypothetical protein